MLNSIQKRLVFLLLLITLVVGSVSLFSSYLDSRHEVQELFDAHLAQSARVLKAMLTHPIRAGRASEIQELLSELPFLNNRAIEDDDQIHVAGHEYERKLAFQVWQRPDKLLLHSASAPRLSFSVKAVNQAISGFSDETIDGMTWRVFTLSEPAGQYVYQTGELYEVRNELVNEISQHLITSSIIGVVILAVMIWFGIGSGLMPLKKIAREVQQRTPERLSLIDVSHAPEEVAPLINALNDLFRRVDASLQKERRFTDDAAHELRTPLAALKTQAQVAMRASDQTERQHALQQVIQGVDRATRLVEQLLTLARSEHQPIDHQLNASTINLYALCADVIADMMPAAMLKGIDIALSGQEDVEVAIEATEMTIVLRNLLDNAVKYSDDESAISVGIACRQGRVVLSVKDTGPGIAAEFLPRVFERFSRAPGSASTGSGLGFAIVQQIARRNHIQLEVRNGSQGEGLVVELAFPVTG